MNKRFEPKLVTLFREGYTLHQFYRDLLAGIIVGVVALPLAIAFGIASGVKPEQGLYTAIIAGFVISAFGGCRVQVSGPTGAFIVVIYEIVSKYGYEGLAVATFIAGILLMVMGFMKMGILLKFIPYPLTVGFTSGIAVIIFSSQIKDFFGLSIEHFPVEFIEKWQSIFSNFHTTNFYALGIGLLSLVIIFGTPKISSKIPGSLLAIIISTLSVYYLKLPVETIGSRFGSVPNSLPTPNFNLNWSIAREMFGPAVTIALLGGIESLLSAVVADGMIGTRHRSNMELVALGLGNILSPIFNGIPATGAIARTATNIKSGGRTPVAGMIHAIVLLTIMFCLGNLAELIPMAALAAILIFVAYNMSEWHAFLRVLKYPRSDIAVLLTTFVLTVLVDLTVAIEVGIGLSAFLFIKRMEDTTGFNALTEEIRDDNLADVKNQPDRDFSRADLPPGVEVFEAFGPIFFSAIDRFKNALARFDKKPKVLILYMKRVSAIDGTGLQAIESLQERTNSEKGILLIAGASGQLLSALQKADFIAEKNVFEDLPQAISFSRIIVQNS